MKEVGLALAALALSTAALAKTAAPPVPAGLVGVLYAQLSPQRWRVGFTDKGAIDGPAVERRILKEAAKLTLRQGFTWFAPIGDQPEPVETRSAPEPSRRSALGGGPSLQLLWGESCGGDWSFAPSPEGLCTATPITPADRWQATTQIMVGHGAAPAGGFAYNAKEVLRAP